MTIDKHRDPEEYVCEHCGRIMREPAKTTTFRYSSETITLAFCRDCV